MQQNEIIVGTYVLMFVLVLLIGFQLV